MLPTHSSREMVTCQHRQVVGLLDWLSNVAPSGGGTIVLVSENTSSTIPLIFVPKPGEGGGRLTAQSGVGVSERAAGQATLQGGDRPSLVFPPTPPVVVFNGVLRAPVSPLAG